MTETWVGQSIERVEDAALLTGRGRFIDDLVAPSRTLHAAILRSTQPHAAIGAIDVAAARTLAGVAGVFTGPDIAAVTSPLVSSVRTPMQARAMATDRVRYVGEPVAIVVADSRYVAEDALDLIDVRYDSLPAVVEPLDALAPDAPQLHGGMNNVVSDRSFCYGDPDAAFAGAARRVAVRVRYPRNTGAPMETYGIIAEYDPHAHSYDVTANFQGPFSIHAVLARALGVGGNRLRLRLPPDSGGSFGVKQGLAPYIVLLAAAARLTGRPVRWTEDRLEHLAGAVSATNRVIALDAAVDEDGRITALDWDQVEDCGAYLRAPEPATLYRMHGNMTGAYDIRNVRIRNRVVLTNKTPTGLVRGFGGPQVYYALERLLQRIAVELSLDPLDVIRTNLIAAEAFPYRTATGALYDSGDYQRAVETAVHEGALASLLTRREKARAAGRLYGIGFAAVVEPSVSNMGYITTVLTAEERRRAGPKNGAQATATVTIDPLGAVTVLVASAPQGQGHRTVLAQVVADVFGLTPEDVRVVTDVDTGRDAWSIASGNYSSRFAPAVAGTARLAADRLRTRLARIAAVQLNVPAGDLIFGGGRVFSSRNPEAALPFARVAATAHWSPALIPDDVGDAIRETVMWTPPGLTPPTDTDEINSSLCHGFIFDFCGVEVERSTGRVRVDRYVTMHDAGTLLHPAIAEGQIRGGFAQAVGAAFFEELGYAPDGSFLTGTFADYLLPTATEVPTLDVLHMQTPSPFTPLGAKGLGEGNCMSTPVCLANAVADALGVASLDVPLLPATLAALLAGDEPAPPDGTAGSWPAGGGRRLRGGGEAVVEASPDTIWSLLLDADALASLIPGAHAIRRVSETRFTAEVTLGVGPVKGRYLADIALSDLDPPRAVTLSGTLAGSLGSGGGRGEVILTAIDDRTTRIAYRYDAAVGGKVAAVGARLLDGAARVIAGQFFVALGHRLTGDVGSPRLLRRLLVMLGMAR